MVNLQQAHRLGVFVEALHDAVVAAARGPSAFQSRCSGLPRRRGASARLPKMNATSGSATRGGTERKLHSAAAVRTV
ncbi:MAG: hypothetical protein DLM61_20565 [Pseudonocardiales bacterium]|nr:MAG: hypothetical protein DLM61_20565 [Pseudonocardiales bacterium]